MKANRRNKTLVCLLTKLFALSLINAGLAIAKPSCVMTTTARVLKQHMRDISAALPAIKRVVHINRSQNSLQSFEFSFVIDVHESPYNNHFSHSNSSSPRRVKHQYSLKIIIHFSNVQVKWRMKEFFWWKSIFRYEWLLIFFFISFSGRDFTYSLTLSISFVPSSVINLKKISNFFPFVSQKKITLAGPQ